MKQTLHCEIGNHSWERESKRGRKPINCPEHQPAKPESKGISKEQALEKARKVKAANAVKREKDEAKDEQRKLKESLVNQQARVKKSTKEEETTFKRYRAKPTDKNFNEWMKVDNRLLGEVTALRAIEKRAERI